MIALQQQIFAHLPKEWQTYPLFREKVELALGNAPILIAAVITAVVLVLIPASRSRNLLVRIALSVFAALPFVVRLFWQISYDTPVSVLTFAADLFLLLWVADVFLRFFKTSGAFERWGLGFAALLLAGLVGTLVRLPSLLLTPTLIFHGLLSAGFLVRLWLGREEDFLARFTWAGGWRSTSLVVFGFLVFFLPFVPNLFSPAPPDADPTSWAGFLGFLFQGQSLSHVVTGAPGEWFEFRYPAGTTATAWVFSHLLNLRASESLSLLWVLTHGLLLTGIISLARALKVSVWIAILFSLNMAVTGWFGLYGGQINRELAYAFGIFGLVFLVRRDYLFAAVAIAAGLVCNSLVALPFLPVFGLVWLFAWKQEKKEKKRSLWWWAPLPVAFSLAYLYLLGTGPSPYQNALLETLNLLTLPQFLENVLFDFQVYTRWWMCLSYLILIAVFILEPERRASGLIFALWFFFTLLLSGIFGTFKPYHWPSSTFGGFTLIGSWTLSMAMLYSFLKERFFPKREWILGMAMLALWLIFLFPGFIPRPTTIFATYSDVRMGRWIEKNVSKKSLIANISPLSKTWGMSRLYFSFAGGDSSRPVLFGRFPDRQLKNGVYADHKPGLLPLSQGADLKTVAAAFKTMGATHLLIAARPETETFVKQGGLKPLHQVGSTYLFSL